MRKISLCRSTISRHGTVKSYPLDLDASCLSSPVCYLKSFSSADLCCSASYLLNPRNMTLLIIFVFICLDFAKSLLVSSSFEDCHLNSMSHPWLNLQICSNHLLLILSWSLKCSFLPSGFDHFNRVYCFMFLNDCFSFVRPHF